MKVINKYKSHLGFGTARILPGESAQLPSGYGMNHPVVKFYLSKGWLKIVGDNNAKSGDTSPASDSIDTSPVSDNIDTSDTNTSTAKPFDRMNKEELQAIAAKYDIEFVDTDTKAMLIDKIKAVQNKAK